VAGEVTKRLFSAFEANACAGGTITMPAQEPHEDRFGCSGAAIVVVESADDVTNEVSCAPNPDAALIALRIRRELVSPDRFAPVAIEGLALELRAIAARSRAPLRLERGAPHARRLLRGRFREPLAAAELAGELGLHRAHLARSFRARYGETMGEVLLAAVAGLLVVGTALAGRNGPSATGGSHLVAHDVFGLQTLELQNFGFNAKPEQDGSADGWFNYRDVEDGSPFSADGPVTCLTVIGNEPGLGA
jgi:hypothetical protein